LKLLNVRLSEPETSLQLSASYVDVAQFSVIDECSHLISRHVETTGGLFQGQQHIAPNNFVDPDRRGRGGNQAVRVRKHVDVFLRG
jgi:hypothetical protein